MALASCPSVKFVPKPASANWAMLVISLEFKNKSDRQLRLQLGLKYDGVHDSKTVNLIDFDKDYAFITEVKPGSHRTRQMLVRGVSEHRKLDRGAGGKREKPLRTRGD